MGQSPHDGAPGVAIRKTATGPMECQEIGESHEYPFGVDATAEHVGQPAQDEGERHEQRHLRRRHEEEHRHQHELCRQHRSRAELELDPREHRVGDDQQCDQPQRRPSANVGCRADRERGGEEAEAGCEGRQLIAAVEP